MTASVSVVVPVFNERENLPELLRRTLAAGRALGRPWELLLVDDGSRDGSSDMLTEYANANPGEVKALLLYRNAGQHNAILCGFAHAQGDILVTLDADLQNPPEEIGRLVAKIEEGFDVVGSVRQDRQDAAFRKIFSGMVNLMVRRSTGVILHDYGCMLRAYDRALVDTLNACREVNTFIPALAYTFAASPTEIEVSHEERHAGESKYSLYKLIRLNFDLVTGFSTVPLQWFSLIGTLLSLGAGGLFVLLLVRRFVLGAEVEGVFTLFALQFFLIGIMLFGIGLLGEYVGRIQQEVRNRPRYRISAVLEEPSA
jgi:undecaprenyl-phosphate 4-deoxy-4-formamido-L-arabinose transferase